MEEKKLVIDIEKIQQQVKKEVLAEEKYWRENDAKLRAIDQRVPTYEDFRQIVLASHLKPLDKGESLRNNLKTDNKMWNTVANPNKSSQNTATSESITLEKDNLINSKPKTNLEFMKIWRILEEKHDDETKWAFLKSLGVECIQKLFTVEINGELLGKFLVMFDKKANSVSDLNIQEDKTYLDLIVKLLDMFPKCNRFDLNRMFLKSSETDACKNLLKKLNSFKLMDENDFKKLEKFYI